MQGLWSAGSWLRLVLRYRGVTFKRDLFHVLCRWIRKVWSMEAKRIIKFVKDVLENVPEDWLRLTTHRLDIYNESKAKVEFLDHLEAIYLMDQADLSKLSELPTAFDYIRLGHPLSCLLEWAIAKEQGLHAEQVISFSSRTIGIMAILRKNFLDKKDTQIVYTGQLPNEFSADILSRVYGYRFELIQVKDVYEVSDFEGTTIFIAQGEDCHLSDTIKSENIHFTISDHEALGSIVTVHKGQEDYISAIQHVRRRETIAMTPADCLIALEALVNESNVDNKVNDAPDNKSLVVNAINKITGTNTKVIVGSSGLSIQYAIMMGLVEDAQQKHPDKSIKIIIPPNCYGGTNDQARRVAACIENVEVVDLPVDSGRDMVQGVESILDSIANEDAVPYIIAEIPTNPRVEIPDLVQLSAALSKDRSTGSGGKAVAPVFILDQTFCPNVHFLGTGAILSSVKTIAYISGSKFPSGGLCTAGFCVANKLADPLMNTIEEHLQLCGNEATDYQIAILAQQLPSMLDRITDAYKNTRALVDFIQARLPEAKINFVSKDLAGQGFTPSVFSLDLPTRGTTEEEKERYKRALNHQLINMMITEIPEESKFCVSYGQLKGCYWTIPATSTQGTTKEGDKDYIVRVSASPGMNVARHQAVFADFVKQIG